MIFWRALNSNAMFPAVPDTNDDDHIAIESVA